MGLFCGHKHAFLSIKICDHNQYIILRKYPSTNTFNPISFIGKYYKSKRLSNFWFNTCEFVIKFFSFLYTSLFVKCGESSFLLYNIYQGWPDLLHSRAAYNKIQFEKSHNTNKLAHFCTIVCFSECTLTFTNNQAIVTTCDWTHCSIIWSKTRQHRENACLIHQR